MTSFIAALKGRLPEADWPVVVAALRNEAQTWAELQDSSFGQQALEAAGGERASWSPGFLGLLRVGHAQQFEALRATPMQAVSEKLRYQAASAYEQLATDGVPENDSAPDLAQATLLALALRERRRLLNGWEQLTNDLSIAPAQFWKLPMACLFDLLPKQHELMEVLLSPDQSADIHELALHALVSNPLTLDVQSAHLLEIIGSYELPQFLTLLRSLARLSIPLAEQAALQALENLQGQEQTQSDGLGEIQRLLLQSEIYQISGQPKQAAPLLTSAWEAAQRLQAELGAKVAESAGGESIALAALKDSGDLTDPKSIAIVKTANKRPAALLSAARVAFKANDSVEAKEMAVAALDSASKENHIEESRQKAALLRDLGELFIELQLPQEAELAVNKALELQSNDAHSASLLSKIMQANGKSEDALQHAHLAAALDPERGELRRNLAKALQHNQQPEEAFNEWLAVLDKEAEPSVEDWLSLAQAALDSAHIDGTIKACQRALAFQPSNGAAYALLGSALLAQGDNDSAREHLRRATELAPAQIGAWLALAEILSAQGALQEAQHTLLAAQQYTLPSAKLQVMLAQNYFQLGNHDQALPAYQLAAQLAAEQAEGEVAQSVALQLSALQRELGQVEAARLTLEAAQQSFPTNPAIAQQLGAMLLEINEPKRALIALNVAREADPENAIVLMNIARAQLATGEQAAEAERTLDQLLTSKGAPAEGKGLLAQALAAQGKHGEAVKVFETALKSTLADHAAWRKTLNLGKARSQAGAGKPVAAILTLENLSKELPGDLEVLRALCAGYLQAGRGDEASQIAQKVYLGDPGNQDTLLWYAEQMHALGKSVEACKTLSKSIKQAGQSPRLTLRLAQLQWQGESHEAALKTLAGLMDQNDAETLAQAGTFLLENHAAKEGIAYLTRAQEMAEARPEWLDALTQAYLQNDQLTEALETLERSIRLSPHKPQGLALKAEILQRLDRPQAALESLEKALDMLPNDIALLASKVSLLRENGDWAGALETAARAFALDTSHPANLQAAAELAILALQPAQARGFFNQATLAGAPSLELACLRAELALQAGEEVEAAKALAAALEKDDNHPRVLALQSQLAACRGDRAQAASLLKQAVQAIGDNPVAKAAYFTLLGIAKAAEKLNDWPTAVRLYETLAKALPGQLSAQFNLGKALLQRAEWQQLCESSHARQNASEAVALSKEARAACKQAFNIAGAAATDASTQALIAGWQARAELRFGSQLDLAALPHGYPSTAAEAAALMFAARRSGQTAAAEARTKSFLNFPEVLLELGQDLLEESASRAQEFILGAARQLVESAPVQALAAQVANLAGQAELALPFVQRALALWGGQPRWQALAGELQHQLGNLAEAAEHFQQAITLEPEESKHYFALGKTQLAAHSISEGIHSLTQAVKIQPKQTDYLLALAAAHRVAGDSAQAKSFAQQAHKAAPQSAAALLLQAELALEAKDPESAKSLVEQALKLMPKDAVALCLFAESLNALGKTEDAIAILERARETAEDELPILIRRAQFLPAGRGLDALVKLSQKYPERSEVFFALSEMLAQAGNLKEAIQAAQRAVKKASASLPAETVARMHLHLGQLLKHSGNLDQSLHQLDEAARLAPHLLESHVERGRVFLARRQQDQAMQAFQQAAAAAPNEAKPHFEAALALKDAKDYNGAEAALRKAAKLAPKDRQIQRQLAAVIALNIVHHPQEAGIEL